LVKKIIVPVLDKLTLQYQYIALIICALYAQKARMDYIPSGFLFCLAKFAEFTVIFCFLNHDNSFLKYSVGCRSPPSPFVFEPISKIERRKGNEKLQRQRLRVE